MLHRGSSYVNLISNSPINTCYPRYGALNFDYLDDTLEVALNYHKTENSNIFCPVQIHVREDPEQKNLLDFDSDDGLLDNENYILIDQDLSFDITPKRHPYPDANSHNYNFFNDKSRSISPFKSHSLTIPYSIANSHNQESTSHTNYVFSDTSDKNEETSYDNGSPYSVENSHGIYKILSESSGRINESLSTELLIPANDHNYDIANSHNYQIFYNSQIQHEIDRNISKMDADDKSSHSSRCTEETSSTCDIEECLIQIEESLLNIEKNLLHVQDLDIPELKHLLYKSPSIERSLFEVQDLLCTENIESARRGELFTLISDESQELNTTDSASNLEGFQDSEQVVFNNEKNVNFVLNSLSRTPTRCKIMDAEKNRAVMKEYKNLDSVNYNYKNSSEEKLCFKKVHSRSNSLDENSIFQSTEFQHERKTSLESIFSGKNYNFPKSKIKSSADLDQFRIQKHLKVPQFRRPRKGKACRLAEVEAKAEEFQRKIKNIISNRNAFSGFANQTVLESPHIQITSTDSGDNEKDKDSVGNKTFGHDRRKRKKINNKSQAGENAVVPSKLISLSLSLLLAALLQAVRCLTDLVEGAFRSISFDQNGVLQ